MTTLRHDIRVGARALVKRPGISALAVIALGLGIGLTTTMFSIVYGVLLRGLPYEDAGRLIAISRTRPSQNIPFLPVSLHDFYDWRNAQTSFDALAAYVSSTVNVSGPEGRPIRYQGLYASAELFDLLGVRPMLGRPLRPEEDTPAAAPVILLSYRAWQDRFGADPDIVGRTIRANSEVMTIVGVMPERFDFPGQQDAWLPLRFDPLAYPRGSGPSLGNTALQAMGRLKDGVSFEQAQTEMSAIASRLSTAYPASNQGIGVVLRPIAEAFIPAEASGLFYTMLAAVFGVLLIACANVANLLLARTLQRSKEIAIRTALGSSRLRIINQVLAESFVLAVFGAVLGLGIAKLGIDWFNQSLINVQPPLWLEIGLDPAVFLFVVGLGVVSTVVAGAMPALRASRADVPEILNDESRGSSGLRLGRLSKALVVAEIALSCGLLVAAGLMIKTVVNISRFDYGFETDRVFTSRLGLLEGDYPTPDAQRRFYDELLTRLRTMPGVTRAALTSHLPTSGSPLERLSVDGVAYPSEQDHPVSRRVVVTDGYFETLGVAPLLGRVFTEADGTEGLPVAVVNQRFVDRHLAGTNPIGARVKSGSDDMPWRTIVGVVPDLNLGGTAGTDDLRHEGLYVPLSQNPLPYMSIMLRTAGAPMTLTSAVQAEVNAIDPVLPLYWVRSLEDQFALNTWFYRAFGTLFMVFGGAALLLATIGLYGVMSFSASNRTREIGVRMALGADGGRIRRLVLGLGVMQLALGLGLGLALAAVLARGIRFLLFNVESWDPIIFIAVIATLTGTGLLACLIPAVRATRVNPVEALRYD